MNSAGLPPDEVERVADLRELGILDTHPDGEFDQLARLASLICRTPMALVSLVDSDRQWFKARVGILSSETPRDVAFCAHAILGDDVFEVPDTHEDQRFADNPLVTGYPRIRFYAGAPLRMASGRNAGTLCVLDSTPRVLNDFQREALRTLGQAVSSQMELRRQLERAKAENQVREKLSAELLESRNQLARSNAQLERASRLKDEFLATMSHELRTPLNTILGLGEALRGGAFGPLAADQAGPLQMIEESGRHLLQLINDILDLSKIEAGRLELNILETPTEKLTSGSLRFIREEAAKRRLRLTVALDPQVQLVRVDPLRMRQTLVNLLTNAVKFTPEGGSIGLEVKGDQSSGTARFTVWDSGIGIAREDLSRLFQPFVQLDASLSRKAAGTGLGLSLVRRLAELHGGCVEVDSEPGRGSRFTISIPWEASTLRETASVEERPLDFASTASAPGSSTVSPLILLAEDNEVNRRIFEQLLKVRGYRVSTARDGREAIERAVADRPALILMDIQMPDIDGLEAIRRIRGTSELARVPIIALTALAMPGDQERCLEAGADDYVSKPVHLTGLLETIRRHLSRAGEGGSKEGSPSVPPHSS